MSGPLDQDPATRKLENFVAEEALDFSRDGEHQPTHEVAALPHVVENPLLVRLYGQLDNLVGARAKLLSKGRVSRDMAESREDAEFVRQFFQKFVESRNERADDIESPEVREAIAIQERFFAPYKTFGALCVDGRTLPILLGGFTGGYGGWLRSPGADIRDFVPAAAPDAPGGLVLQEGSRFAVQFKKTTDRNLWITQILDSHIDCAARRREEEAHGDEPIDKGLLPDVEHKLQISLAMKAHVDQTPEQEKVIPIQVTFNPDNGFSYMGLEQDEPLQTAHEAGGFTKEVLDQMVIAQKVISTENIAGLHAFQSAFARHPFAPNLEHDYRNTVLQFWKAVESMWGDEILRTTLVGKIEGAFGKISREEIDQRAKFLLVSAFSGYLHNSVPGGYKYGKHRESCVVVGDGEHGPFGGRGEDLNSFSVMPSSPKVAEDVLFTAGIIRDNRGKGRVASPIHSARHEDHKTFKSVTVPVVVEEIVRDGISQTHWQELADVDWAKLSEIDWMDNDAFKGFKRANCPSLPYNLITAINALREKMVALYANPAANDTALHLVAGNLVVMAVITDGHRRIHTTIPFMKGGYTGARTNSLKVASI